MYGIIYPDKLTLIGDDLYVTVRVTRKLFAAGLDGLDGFFILGEALAKNGFHRVLLAPWKDINHPNETIGFRDLSYTNAGLSQEFLVKVKRMSLS